MSDGGGQAVVFTLSAYPGFKLYHYEPGGTTLKNIYTDETLDTTAAQPMIADSNGVIQFYALGDYRFKIDDTNDVNRYDWDDYHVSQGQSFISDYGTAYPAATADNTGQGFAKIVSGVLRGLAVNNGSAFDEVYSADASGNPSIDVVRTATHPWYDITNSSYGAVAGEASDQHTEINAAVNAIETAGLGVLFIPEGRFQLDSSLTITNTSITILGLGSQKSVLVQTSNPGDPVIDYSTTDITDSFRMIGVGIETEVAGSDSGVEVLFPSTSGEDSLRNCQFSDVYVGPTASDSATAYFTNNIIVSDAKKLDINDVFLRGHDSLDTVATGLLMNGYTEFSNIKGLRCHHLLTGLETTTNVKNTKLSICEFKGQTQGILLGGCVDFKVVNSTFEKEADSTVDWFGIKGDSTNLEIVGGNSFKDLGSASGTDIGISLDTADIGKIDGNTFDTLDSGIVTTANTTNIPIINNFFNSVTTHITNVNASNPVDNNYPPVWATVASAEPLVGSNATNLWRVTGTTNFNNIDTTNRLEGREVQMTFTGALSIRAGAGDIAVSITHSPTSALDWFGVIYSSTDTKWLEQNFSANS
jgi:hypothetical protein